MLRPCLMLSVILYFRVATHRIESSDSLLELGEDEETTQEARGSTCVIEEKSPYEGKDRIVLRVDLGEECTPSSNCNWESYMEGGWKELEQVQPVGSKVKKMRLYFPNSMAAKFIKANIVTANSTQKKCLCTLQQQPPQEFFRFFWDDAQTSEDRCDAGNCWIRYVRFLSKVRDEKRPGYEKPGAWSLGCEEGDATGTFAQGLETHRDIIDSVIANVSKFKKLKEKVGPETILPLQEHVQTVESLKSSLGRSIANLERLALEFDELIVRVESLQGSVHSMDPEGAKFGFQNVILKVSMMSNYCKTETTLTDVRDALTDLPDPLMYFGVKSFRDTLTPLVGEAFQFLKDTTFWLETLMVNFGKAQGYAFEENWDDSSAIVDTSLGGVAPVKQHFEKSIHKMRSALLKFA